MRIAAFLLLFIVTIPAFCQGPDDDGDIETVFGDNNVRASGIYGAPEIKVTQIKSLNLPEWAIFLGGRGGWIFNRMFSIGVAGYGLVTNHIALRSGSTNYYYRMGMGGIFVEYIQNSNEAIHYTFSAFGGGGVISYSDPIDLQNVSDSPESTGFLVIEPGVNAEVNITRNFRVVGGLSYRLIAGSDFAQTGQQKDLTGLSINLSFKFGRF